MGKQSLNELKERVYKLVDDWLELGDVDEQPADNISSFENWAVKKVEAGTELSSFAEQVIDELLGQFKGTDGLVGQALAEREADAWDEAMEYQHGIHSISAQEYEIGLAANPYRKDKEQP